MFSLQKGKCNARVPAKKSSCFSRSWTGLPSQLSVWNTHRLCKLPHGNFAVGQGKDSLYTENLKVQFVGVPWNMSSVAHDPVT